MPASPPPLSPEGRARSRAALSEDRFDLLVIGGGITGAGVAREAALRGLSVALVEKSDFGAGTSSRSSKIIHGGVRYLEYLQFGMVRESARERRTLLAMAPHLVHPLPFLYPVFGGESFLKIRAGLFLFDFLAGSPKGERSRRLSAAETRQRLPGLRDPLKGAVLYPEYLTDDARFTLANVEGAAELGAVVMNHVEATGFVRAGGRVVGARVRDHETDEEFMVEAEVTVNATGPWAQETLTRSELPTPKRIIPSKGIHILLRRDRLPLEAASFLRSPSGRSGLVMPRGPWVYVGTSDDPFEGDLDRPRAEGSEIDDLVALTADAFPEAGITRDDVVATWAGIRPLIYEEGKSTRDMSRHDEVWISPPGLVTVAGGKLTTYRPMATRILGRVAETRGRPLPERIGGSEPPLPGAPAAPIDHFRARVNDRLHQAGVAPEPRDRLHMLYGTELEWMLDRHARGYSAFTPLHPELPAFEGEVELALRQGARTLVDALDRRMALLLFGEGGGRAAAPRAAEIMGQALGWDDSRRRLEIEAYGEFVREHGPRGIETSD
ncbi:MAG: glycerol-3-phosphate dehydrogenase/oxidase [Gemmatimonadales bacterium]|nr:MAG: glycerol-3-phosphate dehydrogenase/oxidase [Gemmatimonadales bacterium]